MLARGRCPRVPTFTANRSAGEVPSSAPAISVEHAAHPARCGAIAVPMTSRARPIRQTSPLTVEILGPAASTTTRMPEHDGGNPAGGVAEAFRRHRREVERFFAERLPDRQASEDLCQEVFLRFLLAEAAGVRPTSPEAWLRRVAGNLLVDSYRRSGVLGARQLTLSDEAGRRLPDPRTVVNHLEQGQLATLITGAFSALTPKHRRLLYSREVEGLPIRTIARHMRASGGVVATELSRARTQFRRHYARLSCEGLLEPDEEIFDEPATLRGFDPLGLPDDQLTAMSRRGLAYFEAMAPTWDDFVASTYTLKHAERIARALPLGPHMRVLDVGSGTGYLALQLAPHVREVIAVDQSPAMLRQAAAKASRHGLVNVRLLQTPAEHMPLEASAVDLVICHMLMHHVISPRKVLHEFRRVARPGGIVAVLDSDRHQSHWMLTDFADLHCGIDRWRLKRHLMQAGFEPVLMEDSGTWSVVGGRAADFSSFLLIARASGHRGHRERDRCSTRRPRQR